MPNDERQDTISIEHAGKTVYGSRIITGTRVMRQTIYYGASKKYDGMGYSPGQESSMLHHAERKLREMVEREEREANR